MAVLGSKTATEASFQYELMRVAAACQEVLPRFELCLLVVFSQNSKMVPWAEQPLPTRRDHR